MLDLALAAEVLGESALPVPFLGHALAGLAIAWGGSPAQRAAWLPRLATGDALATVAFGEPGERWQPEQWQAELARGRISGRKAFVPDGGAADLFVVGARGGELALVERGAAGVRVRARARRRPHARARRARARRRRGGGAARRRARRPRACATRVSCCSRPTRSARRGACLRMTAAYAGTREQFGTRLAQFQAVKHQLANAVTELEPTRGLLWYAAHAVDHLPERAPHAAAVAKAHITDRAVGVARDAVELHGGIGYTWESDVQIWFKRVLFDRAFLGTPEVHRERSAQLAGW